ncbi:MAG: recombinase family protein [Eubacterium sp.]|nr:recombinase family protein [Eubacterium sp.]
MTKKYNSQKTKEGIRKTALYIRVSTDAQYEEGYSVDAQKEKLKQFCKLRDITNYEFYIDGGWSGSNIVRPEMQRLIKEIKEGRVEAVVVYKLDRLSRSQKDTIFLLEDIFIPNDCNFISLNENFDTTTPYGKAMIGILSVFAQLERENIRERTRMGMYERVKSGLWMGGGRIPFGYDYNPAKNTLVPNEHAEDVKKIFELYLNGYSCYELSQMFHAVANDTHIRNILSRITYCGKIEYNGEMFDGIHEPLISQELYDKTQLELQKRSNKNIVKSQYLLTGFIYCGKCGAKMRYQKWSKGQVVIYCYSQQSSKPNLIKDPNCDNKKVLASEIETIVISDLLKRLNDLKDEGQKNIFSYSSSMTLTILKSQYNNLLQKIKKLYNLYAESDDNLILETINENKKDLNLLKKQIESEEKIQKTSLEIGEFQEIVSKAKDSWSTMSMREKREVVKVCIDNIVISDDDININYKF